MQIIEFTASAFFQIGILFIFLIIVVLFMLTQHKTLKAIQPKNRKMKPGGVWLQFIPIYGLIWQFSVVKRIADSIRKEMASRQDDSILGFSDAVAAEAFNQRPTFQIGIAYCIFFTICFVLARLLPLIQIWFFIPGMICWIIYWVQLAKWKRKLVRMDI